METTIANGGQQVSAITTNDRIQISDADGKQYWINRSDLVKDLRPYKIVKAATINTKASLICSIKKITGFRNLSVLIKGDMFSFSFVGMLGFCVNNTKYTPFFKGVYQQDLSTSNPSALVVDNNNYYDIYITGSYPSETAYSYNIIVYSEDADIVTRDNNDVVNVSSLSPIYTIPLGA